MTGIKARLCATLCAALTGVVLTSVALVPNDGSAAETPLASTGVVKYQTCMQEAEEAPEDALTMAASWRTSGGGVAAEHCMAMALISLGKYADAAKKLEAIAENLQTGRGTSGLPGTKNPNLLPEVYAQAGNAWLMAGNMSRAYDLLSTAIAGLNGKSDDLAQFLIDRSQALVGLKKYDKAVDDLDRAQKMLPRNVDIYIYRAAAERSLGSLNKARHDLITALSIAPDNPDALLENGNLDHLTGNDEGARVNWRRVLAISPDSPQGAAAAKNLSLLNGDKITIKPATHP